MKRIIATVGPSLLNKVPINSVHHNRNIYRINGAHGSISEIEKYIQKIKQQVKNAEILMDLPGNKVRTANLKNGFIDLKQKEEFALQFDQMNYKDFYKHLKIGDTVWANDSIFKFTVQKIKDNKIIFLSESNGRLLNNKGMHVRGIHKSIPFLFQKDLDLIELANKYKLDFIGLSFVRSAEDIQFAKTLIDHKIKIISKVETLSAVENLISILHEVEYILIDRGDLSTEVGLNKVPNFQKYIIDKALFFGKKVFLATHFLKSMEKNPIPTIPEIIDMYNTLKSGVYGIQMSEETAVGEYPKECLTVISDSMKNIHNEYIN